jgi:NAD(P)-dependent dehydrogenase (short-subunit alcohol dehydrogenase family)
VVLITGASSGFGKAAAEQLAARGHTVYGTRAGENLQSSSAVRLIRADVRDTAQVRSSVERVLAEAGAIDVLINNAGMGVFGAVEDMPLQLAQQQFDVNYWGCVHMIQAVLPAMRRAGRGRIINLGSLGGRVGLPFQAHYSATKFALEGLVEALRLELAGSGVDTTLICPGDFKTGFTAARKVGWGSAKDHYRPKIEAALQQVEKDENGGGNPERVSELMVRLVDAKALKGRYVVAKPAQAVPVWLKPLLPASVFASMLRSSYRL